MSLSEQLWQPPGLGLSSYIVWNHGDMYQMNLTLARYITLPRVLTSSAHSHWNTCSCHFLHIDTLQLAVSKTWSSRDAESGPLIGCRAPGSEINAGTCGGIIIRSHRRRLDWSSGLPVTAICSRLILVKRQILRYFWWCHFSACSICYYVIWYGIQRGVCKQILKICYGSVFVIWLYLQSFLVYWVRPYECLVWISDRYIY